MIKGRIVYKEERMREGTKEQIDGDLREGEVPRDRQVNITYSTVRVGML